MNLTDDLENHLACSSFIEIPSLSTDMASRKIAVNERTDNGQPEKLQYVSAVARMQEMLWRPRFSETPLRSLLRSSVPLADGKELAAPFVNLTAQLFGLSGPCPYFIT